MHNDDFSSLPFKKQKYYSRKEALKAAGDYCAYQERSHKEVRNKLHELGHYGDDAEELICELIELGFLNEERFAKAFAGGKFRVKKWGRFKIKLELKKHGVSDRCIAGALKSEIPDEDYWNTLILLVQKHLNSANGSEFQKKKYAVARYLTGRGYEPELIWEALKSEEKH